MSMLLNRQGIFLQANRRSSPGSGSLEGALKRPSDVSRLPDDQVGQR
jgi:hypothetical protein